MLFHHTNIAFKYYVVVCVSICVFVNLEGCEYVFLCQSNVVLEIAEIRVNLCVFHILQKPIW